MIYCALYAIILQKTCTKKLSKFGGLSLALLISRNFEQEGIGEGNKSKKFLLAFYLRLEETRDITYRQYRTSFLDKEVCQVEELDRENEQRIRDRLMSVDWIPIKWDESQIICSGEILECDLFIGQYSIPVVIKSDVYNLVKNIFREVARKLKIRYEEVEPILREENEVFFNQIESAFAEEEYFFSDSCYLEDLIGLLRVPDISQLPPEEETKSGVSSVLKAIAGLSSDEKKELISLLRALVSEDEISA